MAGNPGRYRDPITIQKLDPAFATNNLGELDNIDDSHWLDYFPCFAEVILKGMRDFVRAGMAEADCTHIIRVPFSNETKVVTASQYRVILQVTGEKLHITDAYRKDMSNREVEILAVN